MEHTEIIKIANQLEQHLETLIEKIVEKRIGTIEKKINNMIKSEE